MKKKINIPIFISHQGCPNDCVFCNQKRITGFRAPFDERQIRKQIESYLASDYKNKSIEIAFFGGSFTGIDMEIQKKYLDLAAEYIGKYDLDGIRMSTRPDYVNEKILAFLKQYPVKSIELGVQSLDEEVLLASNRGHSVKDVYNAVELIKQTTIELGLQMMIGLPNDTQEKAIKTAKAVIVLDPNTIRIYPTVIMKDTNLEDMYIKGEYTPLTLDEAIEWTTQLLPLFYRKEIDILRVGLQSSEEVNVGAGIVAGPYHPAFRQLVEEKMLYQYVINYYYEQNESPLDIIANQKIYQNLIGHGKKYKMIIQERNLSIRFSLDTKMKKNLIKLIANNNEIIMDSRMIMKGLQTP